MGVYVNAIMVEIESEREERVCIFEVDVDVRRNLGA